jgi:hypothetical protein
MAMKGNQGISSKNVVRPGVRTGTGSHNARPAGVVQLGYSVGDHATSGGSSGYTGEKLHGPSSRNFQPTKFGNEIAASTVCGPGGSCTVYASGAQGQHGAVAGSEKPQGRPILSQYGPESK